MLRGGAADARGAHRRGSHALLGGEPAGRGGADTGPAPFGLLSGLGACTAITLRMYAEHQSWPLAGVDVELI